MPNARIRIKNSPGTWRYFSKVGAGRAFADEVRDVGLDRWRARVLPRERRDTDTELTRILQQGNEFFGVVEAFRVGHPLALRVARRISSQRQHITHAGVGVLPDHVPQFGDGVVHRGQVADRGKRGLGCDALRQPDSGVARRATRAGGTTYRS